MTIGTSPSARLWARLGNVPREVLGQATQGSFRAVVEHDGARGAGRVNQRVTATWGFHVTFHGYHPHPGISRTTGSVAVYRTGGGMTTQKSRLE
jgi:hypothetical protein